MASDDVSAAPTAITRKSSCAICNSRQALIFPGDPRKVICVGCNVNLTAGADAEELDYAIASLEKAQLHVGRAIESFVAAGHAGWGLQASKLYAQLIALETRARNKPKPQPASPQRDPKGVDRE